MRRRPDGTPAHSQGRNDHRPAKDRRAIQRRDLVLQLEAPGKRERGVEFRLLREGDDPEALYRARIGKSVDRAVEQSFLDRAGAFEKSDDVGRFVVALRCCRNGCRRTGSAKFLDWRRDRVGGERFLVTVPKPSLCPKPFGARPRELIPYFVDYKGEWWRRTRDRTLDLSRVKADEDHDHAAEGN
jgi:hypothetical protein